MKMVKQKVVEKNIPPSIDVIKLIYQDVTNNKQDYESMTDEELELERLRLLKELKEGKDDSRKE